MAQRPLGANALALADGRAVLLTGLAFDAVELVATAAVRELVVVTPEADPEAPAGETAFGAPLRLRPDWNERRASKDLIVDATGDAPPDAVLRILRKAGLYLVGCRSPALAAFPHVTAWGEAFVGSRSPLPPLPELPPELVPGEGSEPAGRASASDQCVHAEAEAAFPEQVHAEAEAVVCPEPACPEPVHAAAEPACPGPVHAEAGDLSALRAALASLDADLEACRTELAGRRAEDRRAALVRERLEAERAERRAEVEVLTARLARLEAPAEELAAVESRRRRAEAQATAVLARLASVITQAPEEPGSPAGGSDPAGLGPPPPVWAVEPVEAWLEAAFGAIERRLRPAGLRAIGQRLRPAAVETTRPAGPQTTDRRLTAQPAAVFRAQAAERADAEAYRSGATLPTSASAPTPESSPTAGEPAAGGHPLAVAPMGHAASELHQRIAALEGTLESMQALRLAERAEASRVQREGQAAEQRIAAATEAATRARREATQLCLTLVAAEDERHRLGQELAARDARQAELEQIIRHHVAMQALLTRALESAEVERETATDERRVAEANLRLLRDEVVRLGVAPKS